MVNMVPPFSGYKVDAAEWSETFLLSVERLGVTEDRNLILSSTRTSNLTQDRFFRLGLMNTVINVT